eukprot:4393676-Amphidinium_carterae.1
MTTEQRGDVAPATALLPGAFRLVRCSPGVTIRIPKDSNMPEEVCRMVTKLHCAHGHLSQQDVSRLLSSQKARPEAYAALKGLGCDGTQFY